MLNCCTSLFQITKPEVISFLFDFWCYFCYLSDCLNLSFSGDCQCYSLDLSFYCCVLFLTFCWIFVYQRQCLNYECNFMVFLQPFYLISNVLNCYFHLNCNKYRNYHYFDCNVFLSFSSVKEYFLLIIVVYLILVLMVYCNFCN